MQLLIGDSGSTKTDLVLIDTKAKKEVKRVTSVGINPSLHAELQTFLTPEVKSILTESDQCIFYASGVTDPIAAERVYQLLQPHQSNLIICDDMLGACRATLMQSKGIVGILGTGSNSCYYDGENVFPGQPSLGFILGDEGGGVHLGKEVIRSYFFGKMPVEISKIFENEFPLTREELLKRVYRTDGANTYLASFSRFLTLVQSPWKDELILDCFRQYMNEHITPLIRQPQENICFIGSVAFVFKNYLDQICGEFSLSQPQIVKSPLEGLIQYHITFTHDN